MGEYSKPEFEALAKCDWIFTEKVDGTNIRVMWDGTQAQPISFGGKTDNAQIPAPLLQALEKQWYPHMELLTETFGAKQVCMYGEGFGGKIQRGSNVYGPSPRFILFDILIEDYWLNRESISELGAKFGCEVVPVIARGSLELMVTQTELGLASRVGIGTAEGLVGKPVVELTNSRGHRVITKIKCRDFQGTDK
jgi:hypothetical protein